MVDNFCLPDCCDWCWGGHQQIMKGNHLLQKKHFLSFVTNFSILSGPMTSYRAGFSHQQIYFKPGVSNSNICKDHILKKKCSVGRRLKGKGYADRTLLNKQMTFVLIKTSYVLTFSISLGLRVSNRGLNYSEWTINKLRNSYFISFFQMSVAA